MKPSCCFLFVIRNFCVTTLQYNNNYIKNSITILTVILDRHGFLSKPDQLLDDSNCACDAYTLTPENTLLLNEVKKNIA